jgi:DNA-binding response OmpR family regulator
VDRKGLVLVVETDVPIRQLVEGWLREARYDVITGTAHVGPGDAPTLAPDLVIVNASHPRDAGPLIRSLKNAHAAPILIVSARFRRGLAGSADAARRLGVRTVLPKPFTRKELLDAVTEAIRD